MNRIYCRIFLPGALFLHLSVFAQGFDVAINNYNNQFQQERVYVHYDKATYLPGETIWFKAYLKEGTKLLATSKTLYIDWVDDNGILLYHTIAPVLSGAVANGQF